MRVDPRLERLSDLSIVVVDKSHGVDRVGLNDSSVEDLPHVESVSGLSLGTEKIEMKRGRSEREDSKRRSSRWVELKTHSLLEVVVKRGIEDGELGSEGSSVGVEGLQGA